MSKYLSVPNGDYKITVQTGGEIILDTGLETGTVKITGNLLVEGETTTVNTTDLAIEDRVIHLNTGDINAAGIQGVDAFSGFEIERGTRPSAFFGYDEDVAGLIAFDNNQDLVKIATNEIDSRGEQLVLNSGTNSVRVNDTVDYERSVFAYDGLGNLTGYDPAKADVIPNAQSVADYVAYNFANVFLRQIGDGFVTVSSIEIDDEENTGVDSVITFKIDGDTVSRLYADRWEFDELRFTGTQIDTLSSNEDLVLKASGTGSIRVSDVLHLDRFPTDNDFNLEPPQPLEGTKLYIENQYTGKSGIYFVNDEGNRDELVSKNRALLFGMLF